MFDKPLHLQFINSLFLGTGELRDASLLFLDHGRELLHQGGRPPLSLLGLGERRLALRELGTQVITCLPHLQRGKEMRWQGGGGVQIKVH